MRWLWVALLLAVPLHAAEVKRAYPASYELVQLTDNGETTLASGQTLLLMNDTVTVQGSAHSSSATLHFRLEPAPAQTGGSPAKLILHSRVEIAHRKGQTRVQVPNQPDSYIQGPKVAKSTFSTQSWRRQGDPTPIITPFTLDGRSYRLTVIMEPQQSG